MTIDPEKILRGLSVAELEQLVNLCCVDGVRTAAYRDDRGQFEPITQWKYEVMGIALRLDYYRSVKPSFRLDGPNWAITFSGTLSDFMVSRTPHFVIRIGPLDKPQGYNKNPQPLKVYVTKMRRRGTLDSFRRDLTLIRLSL